MSEDRHSQADPVELITDPEEKARSEAENGIRQYKAAREIIRAAIENPDKNMHTEFHETTGLIISFIRNVHIKRAIDKDGPMELNFWRVTSGSLLDMAVVEWCKLFGSDNEEHQPVHWKNSIPTKDHDAFRAELYALAGSKSAWHAYWKQVKEYRNKLSAHLDLRHPRPENNPGFDLGLASASLYYDWLMKMGEPLGLAKGYPKDVGKYRDFFAKQSLEIASVALAATSTIREPIGYGFVEAES